MKKLWILFLIPVIFLTFCRKDGHRVKTSKGKVIWEGSYNDGGCGFYLTIQNVKYKPVNEDFLDSTYMTGEEIDVKVKYEILERQLIYMCGKYSDSIHTNAIEILELNKI